MHLSVVYRYSSSRDIIARRNFSSIFRLELSTWIVAVDFYMAMNKSNMPSPAILTFTRVSAFIAIEVSHNPNVRNLNYQPDSLDAGGLPQSHHYDVIRYISSTQTHIFVNSLP